MIKISKMADYATRIMQSLIVAGERASAAKLSALTRIPEATVSKLLKKLTKANLLSSTQGARGGYQLAKSADQVSLAELVIAVDGPVALTSCASFDDTCVYSQCCDQQENWQTISELIFRLLDRITLSDMAARIPKEKVEVLRFVPINELRKGSVS